MRSSLGLGDGRLKILEGVTTPEEVARVTQAAGIIDNDEDEQMIIN